MHDRWQHTPKGYEQGDLASRLFDYVRRVEQRQDRLYERFYRLSCLYDPYAAESWADMTPRHGRVTENVIASNVDTVTAAIAPTKVRPRVLTDDADWSTKRRAAKLSWYGEGLGKKINSHGLKVQAVKESALKGTGLAKVWADKQSGCVRAERVLADDIIVDESECRTREPRQLHHWDKVDRDELLARFPKHREAIEAAHTRLGGSNRQNDDDSTDENLIPVLESWWLPYGEKGKKNYRPGRHAYCISGLELIDEEYHHDFFPIAVMRWTTRDGFFGIGGAERIAGHQRRITKMNWQVDRQLDQGAMPTTYVHAADVALTVKSRNAFGNIGAYKVKEPKTVIAPAVSGETYARLDRLGEKAYEEFGVSRMAATARKPAGIDSGVAMREYRDQTTQRFATQEQAAEQFELDVIWLGLAACKELHAAGMEPPVIVKKLSRGKKKIRWSDVDLGEVKMQLYAASTLNRTPSGRTQSVLEFAQAGIFTVDEARRLLNPHDSLDINSTISLYQVALDNAEMVIEEMLDGEYMQPDPDGNLELEKRYVQAAALQAKADGAPEEVLAILRDYRAIAADILASQQEDAMAMNQNAAQMPQGPEAPPMAPNMAAMPAA